MSAAALLDLGLADLLAHTAVEAALVGGGAVAVVVTQTGAVEVGRVGADGARVPFTWLRALAGPHAAVMPGLVGPAAPFVAVGRSRRRRGRDGSDSET